MLILDGNWQIFLYAFWILSVLLGTALGFLIALIFSFFMDEKRFLGIKKLTFISFLATTLFSGLYFNESKFLNKIEPLFFTHEEGAAAVWSIVLIYFLSLFGYWIYEGKK